MLTNLPVKSEFNFVDEMSKTIPVLEIRAIRVEVERLVVQHVHARIQLIEVLGQIVNIFRETNFKIRSMSNLQTSTCNSQVKFNTNCN